MTVQTAMSPSKGPRFGLATKFAAAMGLLSMLAVGGMAWYAIIQTEHQVHTAFEEEAVSGTELLAENLAWRLTADPEQAQGGFVQFHKHHAKSFVWGAFVGGDGGIAFIVPGTAEMGAEGEAFAVKAHEAAKAIQGDHAHLQAAPVRTSDASERLGTVVVRWSDETLQQQLKAEIWGLALISAAIAVAVGAAAAFLSAWAVARPVRSAAELVGRLAAGERVELEGAERGDEIGALMRSLSAVAKASEESMRIESAVNSSSSPLMLSNLDGEIIYTNTALVESLGKSRGYFTSNFSGLDGQNWIGVSMDKFHVTPVKQRDLLAKLEGTWRSRVSFDDREFSLVVNPLRDRDGTKTGYVVEWEERTDAVVIERELNAVIAAVAAGDFSQSVSAQDDKGFVSIAAHGVNKIVATVRDFMDELAEAVERMAAGDITQTMDRSFEGRLETMRLQFNSYILKMRSVLGEIASAGQEMRRNSAEIQTGSNSLATRAEEQAAALEETAATMEEMNSAIQQNAEGAATAMTTTAEAQRCAEHGGAVTRQAVDAMKRIEGSASQIGDIISVIDGIAFQTNLLALNAAVEAARAGEAGKGFAVVAQEVRSLAQRCADAAQDIKELIGQSSTHVNEGVGLVEATGAALEEMQGVIRRVSEVVESISAGAREQAVGVDEVSKSVCQMDQMTQANASLASESAAAAKALAGQSVNLAEQLSFFTTEAKNTERSRAKPAPSEAASAPAPASKPSSAPLARAAGQDFVEF